MLVSLYDSIKKYFKKNIRNNKYWVKTKRKNPYHMAQAIVVLLLLLPLSYFVYVGKVQDEFFSGVFVGLFVLGLTIILANFLIFESLKNWQRDKDVKEGLAFASSTVREYVRSLELELIQVCDFKEFPLVERAAEVSILDINYDSGMLAGLLREGELEKAMKRVERLDIPLGRGVPRVYRGLIFEVQNLNSVISILPSLIVPSNVYGEAALKTYSFIIKAQKDFGTVTREVERIELLLLEDKICSSQQKKEIRKRLNVRVKHLYALAFGLHKQLQHIKKLSDFSADSFEKNY